MVLRTTKDNPSGVGIGVVIDLGTTLLISIEKMHMLWSSEITFEVASPTNFSTYRRTEKQIKHVRAALEQRGKKMLENIKKLLQLQVQNMNLLNSSFID
jgi:hypothetical protein